MAPPRRPSSRLQASVLETESWARSLGSQALSSTMAQLRAVAKSYSFLKTNRGIPVSACLGAQRTNIPPYHIHSNTTGCMCAASSVASAPFNFSAFKLKPMKSSDLRSSKKTAHLGGSSAADSCMHKRYKRMQENKKQISARKRITALSHYRGLTCKLSLRP